MANDLGAWSPVVPGALPDILARVRTPWWLAGGWALDAHLGRQTRKHEDTDVLILRRDHAHVREALVGWDVHAADPPGTLRPWPVGEVLPEAVHDVWVRPKPDAGWAFQLLNDTEGEAWIYRRDSRIRGPISDLSGPASDRHRQVLAPEIQLLYKSKGLRPKDQQDFEAVLPRLREAQRDWLLTALRLTSPNHPWLAALTVPATEQREHRL